MSNIILLFAIFLLAVPTFAQFGKSALELNEAGLKHYLAGEYDSAIEVLTRAIEAGSTPKTVRGFRPNSLAESSEEKALRESVKVIDSAAAVAYVNRGNVYFAVGQLDYAISDYTDAIRIYPALADSYLRRSSAYLGKKDTARAIADSEMYIKLEPGSMAGYVARGMARITAGEVALAFADINKACELEPNAAEPIFRRGDFYRVSGDGARAEADYRKATKLDKHFAGPHAGLGSLAFGRKDYKAAIEHYTAALDRDPRLAQIFAFRAYAYMYLGKEADAERDAARARSMNPGLAEGIETAFAEIRGSKK